MLLRAVPIFFLFTFIVLSGCDTTALKNPDRKALIDGQGQAETVFAEIHARGETYKRSSEWLEQAYRSFKIRNLNDIPETEYASYGKYITDGNIYFIVHPAYYPFFHEDARLPAAGPDPLPSRSIVERFADSAPKNNPMFTILLEQERILNDFVQFMSLNKKLVILVLPGDYKSHLTSLQNEHFDEYKRYINDLSNGSDSVIYMSSLDFGSGNVDEKDLAVLGSFLKAAGAKNLLIGGGYLGRCVDDFYHAVRKRYSYDQVMYVPELTAILPKDQVLDKLKLLNDKGQINFKGVIKYLNVTSGGMPEDEGKRPRIMRFNLYSIY